MLEKFEKSLRKQPLKRVSNLKEIFKRFLALIHDRDDVAELRVLIEETIEDLQTEKRVNHVGKILT